MNNPWLALAMRIQGIAQAGLSYADNPYDRERDTGSSGRLLRKRWPQL